MPISDFFGAEAGFRLKPMGRLRFGGALLDLRPLTLEQTLVLHGILSPQWEVLAAMDGKPIDEAMAEVGAIFLPLVRTCFEYLFPDVPVEHFDAATPEETVALWNWYLGVHDVPRVMRGIFGVGEPEEDEAELPEGFKGNPAVRGFRNLENATGRKIEELLALRVEAFLSIREDYESRIDESEVEYVPKPRYSVAWSDFGMIFAGGGPGGIVQAGPEADQ